MENATLETALTQTGSLKGDLNFFMRPNDGYTTIDNMGGAPLFPNVLAGDPSSVVKPGAVGFAPNFRNPEIHQAVAAIEQPLPGRIELTASAMLSLGRRLPVFIDTNLAPTTRKPSPTPSATRLLRVPAMARAATSAWGLSRPRRSQFPFTPRPQAQALQAGSTRTIKRSTRSRAKPIRPTRLPWSSSRATAAAA